MMIDTRFGTLMDVFAGCLFPGVILLVYCIIVRKFGGRALYGRPGYLSGIVGLGAALVLSGAWLNGEFELLPLPSTVYASGYTRHRFNQIKVGDTEASVRALLGKPLRTSEWVDWVECHTYGNTSQTTYEISRRDGRIFSIRDTGQGHEISTGDNIAKLRQKLGEPVSITVSKKTRCCLWYSRPQHGGSYWQRDVSVDKDSGRVAFVRASFYADL